MSKHTPGPWVAREYVSPAGCWYVRGPNEESIVSGPCLTSEANAKLIASAPDLARRVELLEAEMARYLPVLECAEKNPGLWVLLTQGTGIATLNGYRAALKP